MTSILDSFKSFIEKEIGIEMPTISQQSEEDFLYFKKGSELDSSVKGNKMNKSHIKAIVNAANMGVDYGLFKDETEADRFIANQFQELRNDFAVNSVDKKGKPIINTDNKIGTASALEMLYNSESGPTLDLKTNVPGKGTQFQAKGKRWSTSDPNSPYVKGLTEDQLMDNAKLALLMWKSKQGKDLDDTTMRWNGDKRYGAKEHLEKVKRREQDLSADYNKDIRDFLAENIKYNSKYKKSEEPKKK